MDISLVQYNIEFEAIDNNLKTLDKLINKQFEGSELLILPEMFNTGFTMNIKTCAESMSGKTLQWMLYRASELNSFIIGSIIIAENNHFFNRLLLVNPNGEILFYDKRHLFSLGNEDKNYTSGKNKLIASINDWKICPLICYDLRFPVWSRNNDDYDILIYVANWPSARSDAWNTLLKARAIENQSYVVACNRVGKDGNGLKYNGDSKIIDYKGLEIKNLENHENLISKISVSKHELQDYRLKYPFLKDRDIFNIC